jgi:cysteine synthase A
VIKRARPETRIIACEPASAALLAGGEWKPHKIQGWTPDFVPTVLDREVFDEIIAVTDEAAIASARSLAQREGIFCGISAGATFVAALEIAGRAPEGSVILAMLPDTGERYLSTVLFEGVETGSDKL